MNDKKALIITFHCCPNYGAVLQLMGLYKYLKQYFKEVEVLDYQPQSLMKEYNYINTYSMGSIIMSLVALPKFFSKRRKFSKFLRSNFKLTPIYETQSAIQNTETDYCFLGSDQIWNPDITAGFDPVYFGHIPSNKHLTRISYAVSIGNDNINDEKLMELAKKISIVDYVSVREQDAKNTLSKIQSKDIHVALDPTLLAGVETFQKLVRHCDKKKPYLFLYTLNSSTLNDIRDLGHEIATKLGLEVIEINGNRKNFNTPNHKVYYNASVEDFVSVLANSNFVVTDSFHGTAFSLLFHRPFITMPHKSRGGRMSNLLAIANLSTRLTDNPTDEIINEKITWADVDANIAKVREESIAFIKKAINRK